MPFPNFHSGRVKNPNLFTSIKVLSTLSNGIMIYGGTLKSNPGGGTTAQTYRFPKNRFTVEEAKKWLRDHDIKYISFEEASEASATQAFVRLIGNVMAFSQNEIIALIPETDLKRIKETDPHPYFTMYSICHEGESAPIIVGEENTQKISWPKRAIESIKNIITKGVKLFKGHNADSSHKGRKVIGEVVHSFQKEIKGKLHHVIIAYHKPEVVEEIKNYDVCSQEATWTFWDYAGQLVADVIDKLTGIALANSQEETPAFAGAKRLGMVQAFQSGGNPEISIGKESVMSGETNQTDPGDQNTVNQGGNPGNVNQSNQGGNPGNTQQNSNFSSQPNPNLGNPKQNKVALSYHEVKEEVERMGLFPSQLFSADQIKKDREFAGVFNELEILKEEKKKVDTKVAELERANALSTAKDRITKIISEAKTPEKISDFIFGIFEEEKGNIADLSDKGLEQYVNTQTKVFQKTAKLIDPEFDVEKKSGDGKGGTDTDPTKAENNPLLEEDYEP